MERRLAAILAADVVGYSRLMEQDEAGTLAALKARRKEVLEPLVVRHHGRIFKVAGDGVLVEFASAVNATQCAVDLQQAFVVANADLPEDRRIVLRIGVNLGDVMAEGGDLYGEGVNIAARLEAIAEPGGILVSGTVYDYVRNKVKVHFQDLGNQNLKNISERVRAYRIAGMPDVAVGSQDPSDNKPSIAVLPFANMSGDPDQEFLSDGITEDIITALSRSVTLSVTARTSTFIYKGRTVATKHIAKELDVGYVLEGSVRKIGNRVRVTAQLIDAGTGTHIWAEKYDGLADEIFDIQDQITRSVASSTHTQIFSSALQSPSILKHIKSQAYRLAFAGNAYLFEMKPESFEKAAALAEQAIAIEPDLPYARRVKANAFVAMLGTGVIPHTEENMDRGVALAADALRRAPGDEWCHWLMAFALAEAGRYEGAVAECDVGLEINPNASMILGDKGDYLVMLGQPAEAIPLCEMALKL